MFKKYVYLLMGIFLTLYYTANSLNKPKTKIVPPSISESKQSKETRLHPLVQAPIEKNHKKEKVQKEDLEITNLENSYKMIERELKEKGLPQSLSSQEVDPEFFSWVQNKYEKMEKIRQEIIRKKISMAKKKFLKRGNT